MATCLACRGKGKVSAMLPPTPGNVDPYVRTVEVACGVCAGTGDVAESAAEPVQEAAPAVLRKPARATTMRKLSGDEAPAKEDS